MQGRGRGGCLVQRSAGAQRATAEMLFALRVCLRAVEQCLADSFHAHPGLRVGVDCGAILLQPNRGRGGDLRCCRRGSRAVEIDDVAAAQACPRYVRGGGRDRRFHFFDWTIVSGHQSDIEVGVGLAVLHDAAGGDHPTEAGGKDDIVRRQVAEIVARRGDDEDALLVERVHSIRPGPRGLAAHAHGDDVNATARTGVQAVHIIEGLCDCAVVKQHDPVGDPHRHDLRKRRAPE